MHGCSVAGTYKEWWFFVGERRSGEMKICGDSMFWRRDCDVVSLQRFNYVDADGSDRCAFHPIKRSACGSVKINLFTVLDDAERRVHHVSIWVQTHR